MSLRLTYPARPAFRWVSTRVFVRAGRWIERRELDLVEVAQNALALVMLVVGVVMLTAAARA